MSDQSDGFELNRRIQSRNPTPTTRMVDTLATLEFDMRQAVAGNPVGMTQWTEWVRKEKQNSDAIVRVLFLIVAVANLSADDVAALTRDLRNTAQSRRRSPKLIREPHARTSPQLW